MSAVDGRREAARDIAENAFTPLLRRLWASDPSVLSASFVDPEGECVDYCASLDPFDAKVSGAQMLVVISDVAQRLARVGAGQARDLWMLCEDLDVLARRVSDEYVLVLVVRAGGVTPRVLRAVEVAVRHLREEAGIAAPAWEPSIATLDVEVRDAVGWDYAPAAFRHEGREVVVADVLGRWIDEEEGGLVCFRVRTGDGAELTLTHDRELGRWAALGDAGLRR